MGCLTPLKITFRWYQQYLQTNKSNAEVDSLPSVNAPELSFQNLGGRGELWKESLSLTCVTPMQFRHEFNLCLYDYITQSK